MSRARIEKLEKAFANARAAHAKNCSGAVRSVAKELGLPLPDLAANGLVDWFNDAANGWRAVDAERAQALADVGILVVAGKQESVGSGHLVIVYPGGMKDSGGFKYFDKKIGKELLAVSKGKFPRAFSTSSGNWPGAQSDGEYTVYDPWSNLEKYKQVKYWAPPKGKVPRAVNSIPIGTELVAFDPVSKQQAFSQKQAGALTADIGSGTTFKVSAQGEGSTHTLTSNGVPPVTLVLTADEVEALLEGY